MRQKISGEDLELALRPAGRGATVMDRHRQASASRRSENPWENRMENFVTINSVASDMGVDPRVVRGIAVGLGVPLVRTPPADFVSTRDAERVKGVLRTSVLLTTPGKGAGTRRRRPAASEVS
jgi:hypothetical protein